MTLLTIIDDFTSKYGDVSKPSEKVFFLRDLFIHLGLNGISKNEITDDVFTYILNLIKDKPELSKFYIKYIEFFYLTLQDQVGKKEEKQPVVDNSVDDAIDDNDMEMIYIDKSEFKKKEKDIEFLKNLGLEDTDEW